MQDKGTQGPQTTRALLSRVKTCRHPATRQIYIIYGTACTGDLWDCLYWRLLPPFLKATLLRF
eukprot:TRINITY_DN2963_c0_g1_i1.p2 TRINITY_DN2963_c0_g1~~TRINITY_DN2963_c0_g1_i1.p2  ORF type:complete len:63 (+),score=7.21 TRINITY_DN2963_c0_g1_i1:183-371(+)